jgi:hypothetical protein
MLLNNKIKYFEKANTLEMGGFTIFDNGTWAIPIPTKTRQEAEKELNCKIVDYIWK